MNQSPLQELASLARCPYTGDRLQAVPADAFAEHLTAEAFRQRPPETSAALISAAAGLAFPVVRGVARFLESDGLALRQGRDLPAPIGDSATRDAVQSWYEDFGWQPTDDGSCGDTALFSQQGHEGHGFYEAHSHLRPLEHLVGGAYLLDAASGPIAHPEYLAYSWYHRRRVCVDLSLAALETVSARLGAHALCLRADLRRLPFADDSFQGVVSGYTVQHVAAQDQEGALAELYRVLAPGHRLCVMTNLAPGLPARLLRALLRRWPDRPAAGGGAAGDDAAPLYCHLQNRPWWRHQGRRLGAGLEIRTLRLLQRDEFRKLFASSTPAARRVLACEAAFPRLLAPFAEYGLVTLAKANSEALPTTSG
ncbi:MAG: class I SAM-dependent methyltransferase [Acidobacteriota bacterium]